MNTDALASLRTYWNDQIQAWKESGLSGAKFCKKEDLVYHRFVYWRQKLCGQPDSSTPKVTGFARVTRSAGDSASGLSIALPNGIIIRCVDHNNVSVVKELLGVL